MEKHPPMPKRGHGTRLGDLLHFRRKKIRTGVTFTNGQEILTDPEHAVAVDTRPAWTQIIATPAPNKTVLSGTSYFNFILENTSSGAMDDLMIRFKIKFGAGSDHRLMPVTQWFERIEWYDRLTGTELARVYGDTLHMSLMSLSQAELNIIANFVNVDPTTGRHTHRTWKEGDEEYFFLPMMHQWISKMNLDLSVLRGDLEIRFYPRGNIHVYHTSNRLNFSTTDYTAPSFTLEEMRLMQSCTLLPNGLKVGHFYPPGFVPEQRFVDWVQYVDYGRSLEPSKEFRIQLDQFSHKSGSLFVLLRRSGLQNVTGAKDPLETIYPLEGKQLFMSEALGDNATVDYEDIQGRSLLGEGTPVDAKYLRKHTLPLLFNKASRKNTNTLIIPFSNDLKNMIHGDMDGYRVLRGDRESIKIVTDVAPRPTYDAYTYTHPALESNNEVTLDFKYNGRPIGTFKIAKTQAGADSATPVSVNPTYTAGVWSVGSKYGLKQISQILNMHKLLQEAGLQLNLAYATTPSDTKTWSYDAKAGAQSLVVEYLTLNNQPKLFQMGEIGQSRLLDVVITTGDGAGIWSSSQIGRRGFNAGLYDIYVYSAYFRYLHLVDGRFHAAAA